MIVCVTDLETYLTCLQLKYQWYIRMFLNLKIYVTDYTVFTRKTRDIVT